MALFSDHSSKNNLSLFVSTPKGLRPANFWDVTVSNVLYAWELLGRRPLRVVVDAYFATASFIKPLMEKGIAVILHLRKNAVGWDDYHMDAWLPIISAKV